MSDESSTTETIGRIDGPADVGPSTTYVEPEDVCLEVAPGEGQREWSLAPCDLVEVGEPPTTTTTLIGVPDSGSLPVTGMHWESPLIALALVLAGMGVAKLARRR